jgi:hypothetical protein
MVRIKRDSRLGMSLLARLDRMADAGGPAAHANARLISGDFETFLDLIEGGDSIEEFFAERAPQCELGAPQVSEPCAPAPLPAKQQALKPKPAQPVSRRREAPAPQCELEEAAPTRQTIAAYQIGEKLLAENEEFLSLNRHERRRLATLASKSFRHEMGA